MATPLFCFSCNSLQRLSSKPNYFEIFNLPYTYDLKLEQLEEQYQHLAVELHPDFYANATTTEKRQSQESSTLLNQAYTVLKSPLSRANYLMTLLTHGKPFNPNLLPEGFLEEIFELQEALEELLADESKTSEVETFQTDIQQRLEQLQSSIAIEFAQIEEGASNRDSLLADIQLHLNVGRYYQRLLDRISRSAQS